MSQQGERRRRGDWWSRLYGGGAADTGGTPAGDSVDDRFASAARTVGVAVAPAPPAPGASGAPETCEACRTSAVPGADRGGGPDPAGGPEGPAPVRAAGREPDFVGDRPPIYEPEPTSWPAADPEDLADLVPDTVLDGARYGSSTLRVVSLRGDSARYRGEPRRDALLTARFGSGGSALVLIAVATGDRAAVGAHRAARDVCRWIGAAVGRSHERLSEDLRAGRRGDLKSGLRRLVDSGYGKLRAQAVQQGLEPAEYLADLHCLLLPADPACRVRVFFGAGGGGLFRLRDGVWQDIGPGSRRPAGGPPGEGGAAVGVPAVPSPREEVGAEGAAEGAGGSGDSGEADSGAPRPFRFRASLARPGDTLLLCSAGLAEPMRGERAFANRLADYWAGPEPPGLARFLADAQLRAKGYADDRTAAAVWEH